MLSEMWQILGSLAPWLFVGMAVTGVLHAILPPNFLRKHLRGRGSVLKSVTLGVPMPLCSCGVIPAGIGLKKDGASDGAALGFLISTPQTGVDSILVSATFLGWPFAFFKVVSAFVTGWVGGVIANRVSEAAQEEEFASDLKSRTWRDGFEHAIQVLRSIWKWLVFGVVASAVITLYIPQEGITQVSNASPLLTCLAVLILSTPLYVCATASVPIAAALVSQGMPMSAALVFLMAGPATNVATIGAIYRAFGRKQLTVYLGTIILGSLGFGLTFDSVISQTGMAHIPHEHALSWWAHGSAGVLFLFFLWFGLEDFRGWIKSRSKTSPATVPTIEFSVSGMSCGGCVKKIERAFEGQDQVDSVTVSLDPGQAIIHGSIKSEDARAMIEELGFQVS